MKIIENYEKYYNDPSTNNAEDLWDSITNYNFEFYDKFKTEIQELFLSQTKKSYESTIYRTNGSTGASKQYFVGPNSEFWLDKIESWKEFQSNQNKKCLFIFDSFPDVLDYEICSNDIKDKKIDYLIKLNFIKDPTKSFSFLESQIKQKYETNGPLYIFSKPQRYLFLFAHQDVREMILENKHMINSIITCDWEPFFKKKDLINGGVHINDQMLNWHTCVNFKTCTSGNLHFLPTFIYGEDYILNLINLCNFSKMPIDDELVVSNKRELCPCGKYYLPIKFYGHREYQPVNKNGNFLYDSSICEHLESIFLNINFTQDESNLYISYISKEKINKKDIEFLSDWSNKNGLNPIFLRNRFLSIGERRKLCFFWNNKNSIKKYNIKTII